MRLSSLLALAGAAAAQSNDLQSILSQAGTGNYTYPTALTRGIIPKALHSHNDYWRPVPFYSALAAGAVSVEADVWLINGTLYVGHERAALTPNRTLDSLYIQPILSVLRSMNPNTSFTTTTSSPSSKNGVYDTAGAQTLYLWIDLKTDGAATWPRVVEALDPLRRAGYLAAYNGSAVVPGPVTVIGTGNTPLDLVQRVARRDYFWDAPVAGLNSTFSNVTKEVSPVASGDFAAVIGEVRNRTLSDSQLAALKSQVAVAHAKGVQVRYWDLPGWPVGTRNAVWRTLWDAGVDLINVDDIDAAAAFWESDG